MTFSSEELWKVLSIDDFQQGLLEGAANNFDFLSGALVQESLDDGPAR